MIKFIIFRFLHHNWECVIWVLFYLHIQGILISFCFILSNVYIYYTFIFSLCSFTSLFIIYIIWEFFYLLIQGILISFCLIFSNISVYYTIIFNLYILPPIQHLYHTGIILLNYSSCPY